MRENRCGTARLRSVQVVWKDLLSQKVKGYWWEHGYTNTSLLNKQRDARASDTADSGLSTSLKGEKKLLKLYGAHAQASCGSPCRLVLRAWTLVLVDRSGDFRSRRSNHNVAAVFQRREERHEHGCTAGDLHDSHEL